MKSVEVNESLVDSRSVRLNSPAQSVLSSPCHWSMRVCWKCRLQSRGLSGVGLGWRMGSWPGAALGGVVPGGVTWASVGRASSNAPVSSKDLSFRIKGLRRSNKMKRKASLCRCSTSKVSWRPRLRQALWTVRSHPSGLLHGKPAGQRGHGAAHGHHGFSHAPRPVVSNGGGTSRPKRSSYKTARVLAGHAVHYLLGPRNYS